MKKLLLLFFVAALAPTLTSAQTLGCVRDSNVLITGGLLSPAPYSPDSPYYNLRLACIEETYDQSVTVNVPATYTYQGFTVPITKVVIATTGAIGNYPAGMTYSCDPPNCEFPATTLGCIHLQGTPSNANPAPDTLDLEITANVVTGLGTLPVKFPGDAAPDNHYYLILNPMGECQSATDDPNSPFSQVKAMPNPFTGQTIIDVQSAQTGIFQFNVYNMLGKRMHSRTIQLYEGQNQFSFDGANLPPGTYIYTIGNPGSQSIRRLVKL